MTFKERIDRLLEIKELDKLSINKIEKALGVDGTIYKGTKDPKYIPSSDLVSEIVRIYKLKKSWWDSPVSNNPEDIYVENGTPMPKSEENNGKPDPSIEEAIRNLIEGNTEYILMHKVVILDKYRLVSVEDLEKADKELERKQDQITGLYEIIKTITSKLPEPVKLPEVHKA